MKSAVQRGFALLSLSVAWPATAQVTIPQEYDKTIKSAEVVGSLGADLFGDQTNLYTGSTSFIVTDVRVPGNSALPMAVGRRFVIEDRGDLKTPGLFADWELEIPHLHGIFAKTGPSDIGWQVSTYQQSYARCSVSSEQSAMPPTMSGVQGGLFDAGEYWHGNSIYIPGQGDQEMLVLPASNPYRPTDGKSYHWVTNNQWYFSCLTSTANGLPGEAFLAIAPDGSRYWFDWFARRPARTVTKEVGDGPLDATGQGADSTAHASMAASSSILKREEIWILPTRVEDRFGNSVTYAYNSGSPWRLESITSSDGRSISIAYDTLGRISAISVSGRTWTYTYNTTSGLLTGVALPDGSSWSLNMAGLASAGVTPMPAGSQGEAFFCETRSSSTTQATYSGSMTHPSGATGTFVVRGTLHGRSYVPKQGIWPAGVGGKSNYAMYPHLFDTLALQTKTIAGPGVPPMQWDFVYGPPNNSWSEDCTSDCVATKTVEVLAPGGIYTRQVFGNRYKQNEGKLLLVESGTSSANLLRTQQTSYLLDRTNQNYPASVGLSPYFRGDRSAEKLTPVILRETRQQGQSFQWKVNQSGGVYALDVFARPTSTTSASFPTP
jgi:YD repeat-containing protein